MGVKPQGPHLRSAGSHALGMCKAWFKRTPCTQKTYGDAHMAATLPLLPATPFLSQATEPILCAGGRWLLVGLQSSKR
eukprot:365017-Chlamydomonas_euryale.AAC.3